MVQMNSIEGPEQVCANVKDIVHAYHCYLLCWVPWCGRQLSANLPSEHHHCLSPSGDPAGDALLVDCPVAQTDFAAAAVEPQYSPLAEQGDFAFALLVFLALQNLYLVDA